MGFRTVYLLTVCSVLASGTLVKRQSEWMNNNNRPNWPSWGGNNNNNNNNNNNRPIWGSSNNNNNRPNLANNNRPNVGKNNNNNRPNFGKNNNNNQPVTFPSNPSTTPPPDSFSNWGRSPPWGLRPTTKRPPKNWGPNQPWGGQLIQPSTGRPNRPPPKQTTRTTTPKTTSTTPYIPSFIHIHTPPEGCVCSRTLQFNPVCGTDGQTYSNRALLDCYKTCGTDVQFKYMGNCRRSSTFVPVG